MKKEVKKTEKKKTKKDNKKDNKKLIIIGSIIAVVIIGAILYLMSPNYKYSSAVKLEKEEKLEESLKKYKTIKNYKDSKKKIKELEEKISYLDKANKIINNMVVYYNGGSDQKLNQITFNGKKATITEVYYDGNGQHTLPKKSYKYKVDTQKISLKDKFDIKYKIDGENIVFEDGKYFTSEQVIQGLQGYWKLRVSDYILGLYTENEYNIYIHDNIMTVQSAAKAAFGSPGDYYYSGPEDKEYTLKIGEIATSGSDSTVEDYEFNIINNQVTALRFGKVMDRADSLPDVNSYSF